ncbi:MAG: protein phosphatase 2C domain-containing protein [Novosphingobium sp.]
MSVLNRFLGRSPHWSGCSKRGGRNENQDTWTAGRVGLNRWAVVLADGLGGHADGRLAADTAVKAAMTALRRSAKLALDEAALSAARAAAHSLAEMRRRRDSDMASTLCLLVFDRARAAWAHCGDSRLYRLESGGSVRRLTVDHSAVMATLPEDKRLTADVRDRPGRNRLVAVLGMNDPLIDQGFEALAPGIGYALCSDGYWESAADDALFQGLGPSAGPTELVDDAVLRQGPEGDNVTLAVVWPMGRRQ